MYCTVHILLVTGYDNQFQKRITLNKWLNPFSDEVKLLLLIVVSIKYWITWVSLQYILTSSFSKINCMWRGRLKIYIYTNCSKHETNKQTNKQTDKQTNKQTNKQTDKQTNRQINKQTNRQTDKQTNKQTDKQINKQTNS